VASSRHSCCARRQEALYDDLLLAAGSGWGHGRHLIRLDYAPRLDAPLREAAAAVDGDYETPTSISHTKKKQAPQDAGAVAAFHLTNYLALGSLPVALERWGVRVRERRK
jgi:hypothetical protein